MWNLFLLNFSWSDVRSGNGGGEGGCAVWNMYDVDYERIRPGKPEFFNAYKM